MTKYKAQLHFILHPSLQIIYFVKTDQNWVAEDDSIHIHSLIGFFSDFNKLNDSESKNLMQKWGMYFRTKELESNLD